MTFEEMAKKRYSVKKFKNTPVEPEKLQKIFEVAGIAPTARNAQAAHIYVIKSPEALKKANELTPCIYGAPIALLFTYSTKEYYPYPKEPTQHSGDEDAAILATHVMFEALESRLATLSKNFKSDVQKRPCKSFTCMGVSYFNQERPLISAKKLPRDSANAMTMMMLIGMAV